MVDPSKTEFWLERTGLGHRAYVVRPGMFVPKPEWKRLRVSRKGGYWSGVFCGVKYRVPFDDIEPLPAGKGWTELSDGAGRWANAPAPTREPEPVEVVGVTLEELFAEDDD